ncbi:MAG: glycosyltransferase family 2 protein [Pseudomonadota bacterium]
MGWVTNYRLRLRRRRLRIRALRKSFALKCREDRTKRIASGDVLLFMTMRNEYVRLPYFLNYYRDLGVSHFLIVDNGSTDGGAEFLQCQKDVSLWSTKASYKQARFGMDWLTWLQMKYAHDHWCLTVDADEFFVYPFCDTRPLPALTDWLDASAIKSFSAMILDMYPKEAVGEETYHVGQDPFEILSWFDPGNYMQSLNPLYRNTWIQGGPRMRLFFDQKPEDAPALNKIPLVKWDRRYAYVSSTHMLLPRGLNLTYDEWGGEKASGCLLHAKFIDTFSAKAREEIERKEHFAPPDEYKTYAKSGADGPVLWCKWSEKYINWRQLEILGLMSKGNWA